MKVFLCYPCGEMYQRGEDRCQSNIKASTSTAMRACNDLGYMAAILRRYHSVFLRDYQTEKLTYDTMLEDIISFKPNFLVLSTTNATVFSDIAIINRLKKDTSINFKVVLKGAIFFNADFDLLRQLDLTNIDILVGGEIDWVIKDIVENTDLSNIKGIFYKDINGEWRKNDFSCWNEDLDNIPFPARDLMKNELYIRPDTGEPMATIQTARGCPSNCIYCLTPIISGKNVRFRTPQNVFQELVECYDIYNIRNFFFKADTFTINKEWVFELCDLIKNSHLYKNIEYTVNSRVKPISIEVLEALKDTGCFTIAYGFESGSEETLKLIKKGVTLEDAYNAVEMTKKVGISIFGFFMIGFPWENLEHIKETEKLIFDLNCDFIEVHIALPYYGSEFYNICKDNDLLNGSEVGSDYFHTSMKGTNFITNDKLVKIRKNILFKYCCRPSYIINKLIACKFKPKIVRNYFYYGFRLIKNIFKRNS